jgi:uncharacterized protein YcbK (DUF882 family)
VNGVRALSVVSHMAFAGLFLLGANDSLQTASAEGDTRTLSFRHLHTGENITITYKRDGRYDDDALKKLDLFMRDWRKDQSTHMDPHLFDLLWEVNREVGGTKPIEIICGYRAPGTNAMLRQRSSGVAQNSQHVNGQAIDFEIPGVPLEKIREVGLRLQRGGVGFYPTSGSPFVHLDTGSVRHWPRMTHDQLVKVFPNGRTVHIPSDGQPLPGYALALGYFEARGGMPIPVWRGAARAAGIDVASAENAGKTGPKRSLLARLFGAGKDEDEADEAEAGTKPVTVASLKKPVAKVIPKPVAVAQIVPLPAARPKLATVVVAQANAPMTPAGANVMFDHRGIWTSAVDSGELPPPAMTPPFAVAAAEPYTTASTGNQALAYAPAQTPSVPLPKLRKAIAPRALPAAQAPVPQLTSGAQRPDSPWLRAAMLTPSFTTYMSATPQGAPHMRVLASLYYKPAQSLVMTFSDDPHLGLTAANFSGSAVVFLATATFTRQQTAALQ